MFSTLRINNNKLQISSLTEGFLYSDASGNISNITGITGGSGGSGSQGVTGERGMDGITGAQGDTGEAGPQGLQGVTGITTVIYVYGDTGSTGSFGNGAQGVTGERGIDGVTGERGATGEMGAQGVTGAPGEGFTDGIITRNLFPVDNDIVSLGSTALRFKELWVDNLYTINATLYDLGSTGVGSGSYTGGGSGGGSGTVGNGATGPQGATGPSGGPAGPQGFQGVTGPAGGGGGGSGATGPQGLRGVTGLAGPQGVTGPSGGGGGGATGPAGPQGLRGVTGVAGPQGVTGPAGSGGGGGSGPTQSFTFIINYYSGTNSTTAKLNAAPVAVSTELYIHSVVCTSSLPTGWNLELYDSNNSSTPVTTGNNVSVTNSNVNYYDSLQINITNLSGFTTLLSQAQKFTAINVISSTLNNSSTTTSYIYQVSNNPWTRVKSNFTSGTVKVGGPIFPIASLLATPAAFVGGGAVIPVSFLTITFLI